MNAYSVLTCLNSIKSVQSNKKRGCSAWCHGLDCLAEKPPLFPTLVCWLTVHAFYSIWKYSIHVLSKFQCKPGHKHCYFYKCCFHSDRLLLWLSSWLAEQEVRDSIPGLAATVLEIGYLLLPIRDIAERSLKRHKSSKQPTNPTERLLFISQIIYSANGISRIVLSVCCIPEGNAYL